MASNRLIREQMEDLYRTNKMSVPFELKKLCDIIENVNHVIYTKEKENILEETVLQRTLDWH